MKPKEGFTYIFLRFPDKGVTIDGAIDSASAQKVLEVILRAEVDKEYMEHDWIRRGSE